MMDCTICAVESSHVESFLTLSPADLEGQSKSPVWIPAVYYCIPAILRPPNPLVFQRQDWQIVQP